MDTCKYFLLTKELQKASRFINEISFLPNLSTYKM